MADPFRLDALRESIPSLHESPLQLRSFKEALAGVHPVQSTAPDLDPDVSMADISEIPETNLSEDDSRPVEAKNHASDDTHAGRIDASRSEGSPINYSTSRDQADSALTDAISLFSPTTLGAQKALGREQRWSHHAVEINMPIPAPWHKNLAYMLSTYLQLAFNVAAVLGVFAVVREFRRDVDRKLRGSSATIIREASRCAHLYIENECYPGKLRPALEEYCAELEECMEKDPADLSRVSVYASALAEIVNAFFEPISLRALGVCVVLIPMILFTVNYLFGFIRAKTYYRFLAHPPQDPAEHATYKITPVSGADEIWR